jgi:hypothetical protein
MNKKGLALDKEVLIGLLIVAVFAAVIIIGFSRMYSRTQTTTEGFKSCDSFGGECMAKDEVCDGQEVKKITECDEKDMKCCVTKESIAGLT